MNADFQNYKRVYALETTPEITKQHLLQLMKTNIKQRFGQEQDVITIDGQEYSINSDNVEDLYAIDGFLSYEESKNQMLAIGDRARQQAQDRNNYGPNNPYPNN